MKIERANYQAFNVGGGRQVTVREYAQLISDLIGCDFDALAPGKYRFGDTRHIFSDVSKLRALGWKPEVTLQAIAEAYIAWAQTQPDLRDYTVDADRAMADKGTVRIVRH